MSDLVATADTLPVSPIGGMVAQRRHIGLLIFAIVSLGVSMSLGQMTSFESGSLQYWLLLGSVALLPIVDAGSIVRTLHGPAKLLLGLLLAAGVWHLSRSDVRAVLQLGLLVFMLAWISTPRARFAVKDLVTLYAVLVVIGIGVNLLTEFSPYGLVPGRTIKEFGIWRVSFFPNVAYSGILSLAMLMVLTKDRATVRTYPVALGVALYFLAFSFVRTAIIGFALYVMMRCWLGCQRVVRPAHMFWLALVVGIGATVLIASSAGLIQSIQHLPYVPELLLQGKTDLSAEEILDQMYRPWLWMQQLDLFVTSPWLMGRGSFDFFELMKGDFESRIVSTGSEALLTRLLSVYGIPGLAFSLYIFTRLRQLACRGDRWACACFPTIFLLMMNWGSVFHPTDALFAIFLLMVVRGAKAYTGP